MFPSTYSVKKSSGYVSENGYHIPVFFQLIFVVENSMIEYILSGYIIDIAGW